MIKTINSEFLFKIINENPEFLKRLPKKEQLLYNYYIVHKMDQHEIAKIFKVTQGAISSRLKRITTRFKFMEKVKTFDLRSFENKLSDCFDAFEIELLKSMLETTCQSETAKRLNALFNLTGEKKLNQVKVRHRFEKYVLKLKTEEHQFFELFNLVKNNLYMLHEVMLPHFYRGL